MISSSHTFIVTLVTAHEMKYNPNPKISNRRLSRLKLQSSSRGVEMVYLAASSPDKKPPHDEDVAKIYSIKLNPQNPVAVEHA